MASSVTTRTGSIQLLFSLAGRNLAKYQTAQSSPRMFLGRESLIEIRGTCVLGGKSPETDPRFQINRCFDFTAYNI